MYPHVGVSEGVVDSGTDKVRCKWNDVYLLFQDDERYLNLLGNPGLNPIGTLLTFWTTGRRSTRKSTSSQMRSSGTTLNTLLLFKLIKMERVAEARK